MVLQQEKTVPHKNIGSELLYTVALPDWLT